MDVVGRDEDAYLVVDGPVGAILWPDAPPNPVILPVASILGHREFDPFDGRLPPALRRDGLVARLSAARADFEAGEAVEHVTT